ncbi:MAG: type II secretion system F family protein, partial [Pirellulaceae bacterium]
MNDFLLVADINYFIILPVAVFFAVFSVIWMLADVSTKKAGIAEQRLDVLSSPYGRRIQEKMENSASEAMAKAFEAAAPALAKPLTPQNEKEASKLKQRLMEAGFRSESTPMMFLSIKLMTAAIFLFLSGGTAVFIEGMNTSAGIKAIIGGGVGFYGPELVLRYLGSRRKKDIFQCLPDALDMLVVWVEAGVGLDQAM